MPIQPVASRGAQRAWARDPVFDRLLGDIRTGSLVRGTVLGFTELSDRLGVSASVVRHAVDRLETIGLVHPVDERRVSVAETTVEDWVDGIRTLVGLNELCTRWAIPTLDDEDRTAFVELVERARRQAAHRDFGYTETMLGFTRFFMDRVPNPVLALATFEIIERIRYVLTPTPPFEQWQTNDYLSVIEEAVASGDAELGTEAAHALIRHIELHVTEVRAKHATMDG